MNHLHTPRRTGIGHLRVIGTLVAVAAIATACGDDADPVSSLACDRYAELQARVPT